MKKRKPDWEAICRDYSTTNMSLQEIASKHGDVVTRQAIGKRAKVEGWKRDLTGAVKRATNQLVIERVVERAVARGAELLTDSVAVAAAVNVQVIESHRAILGRMKNTVAELAQEMAESQMAAERAAVAVDRLIKLQDHESPEGQQLKADAKMVLQDIGRLGRLDKRIDMLESLSRTLRNLVPLERLVWGIDEKTPPEDESWEGLLAKAKMQERKAAAQDAPALVKG